MATESKNNTKILIAVIALLVVGIGALAYFFFNQKTQIQELQEVNLLNKQELEDEYGQLSYEYEKVKMNLKNDSLLQKLNNEQTKVQRLLEELKTVKADNQTEISRLKNELGTLRQVLRSYVVQIDSLNQANAQLRQEKQEITDRFQETTRTLSEVSQQRQDLSDKVTLAAKLDATNVSIQATNSKGKVQKSIKKIEQFVIKFVVAKNITAEPGERTIYARIMKPDDDVLVKSRTNVFPYENRDINYSIKRIIEYGGEETPVTMYWNVEEYLMPGKYRLDLFADGNLIGSKSFALED